MTQDESKLWTGWRLARWGGAAVLLLVPLLMMQISTEWNWGFGSFVFAGAMLGGTLLLFEWAGKISKNVQYRIGVIVALAACFLLVWVNLAVGIVGDEDNPVNLSFFCVVLAAAVGSFAARFQPQGMARAMLGIAAMQGLLGVAIGTAPSTARDPAGVMGVAAVTGFFVALWLTSAALFRKAE